MRLVPVLGTKGKHTVPYDLLKQHEEQILTNHGQTLDRISERGGLSWIEIYYVINNRTWPRSTITDEEAAIFVNKEMDKFLSGVMNDNIAAKVLGLRPCLFSTVIDGKRTEVSAYFHGWVDDHGEPKAIVELKDGSIKTSIIECIRFIDMVGGM